MDRPRMRMSDLKISVFDHFMNYYYHRSVGIITDKQFVFWTQTNNKDGFNHDTALPFLDKHIYPFKDYDGFYQLNDNDAVFASSGEFAYLDIPNSISENQKEFLNDILQQIGEFNSNSHHTIQLIIENMVTHKSLSTIDMLEAKTFIDQNFVIRSVREEYREIIIGKTIEDFRQEHKNDFSNVADQIINLMEQGADIDGTGQYDTENINGKQMGYTMLGIVSVLSVIACIGIIILGIILK